MRPDLAGGRWPGRGATPGIRPGAPLPLPSLSRGRWPAHDGWRAPETAAAGAPRRRASGGRVRGPRRRRTRRRYGGVAHAGARGQAAEQARGGGLEQERRPVAGGELGTRALQLAARTSSTAAMARRGGLLLPPHLAASALRPCRPWPWRLGTVALAARHDGLGLRIQARGGVNGLRWRRGPPPPSVARRGAAAAAGLLSRGEAGLQGGAGAAGLLERPAPRGLRRRSLGRLLFCQRRRHGRGRGREGGRAPPSTGGRGGARRPPDGEGGGGRPPRRRACPLAVAAPPPSSRLAGLRRARRRGRSDRPIEIGCFIFADCTIAQLGRLHRICLRRHEQRPAARLRPRGVEGDAVPAGAPGAAGVRPRGRLPAARDRGAARRQHADLPPARRAPRDPALCCSSLLQSATHHRGTQPLPTYPQSSQRTEFRYTHQNPQTFSGSEL